MFVHHLAATAATIPLAGGSLFGLANHLGQETSTTIRVLTGVIALGFFVFKSVKAHGAFARVLVAAAEAGFFFYVVFHFTTVQNQVSNTARSDGPVAVRVVHPTPPVR